MVIVVDNYNGLWNVKAEICLPLLPSLVLRNAYQLLVIPIYY